MERKIIISKRVTLTIVLGWSIVLLPTFNWEEEFSVSPDQERSEPIVQSASLAPAQKEAIQLALKKIFTDQIASTAEYAEIVKALAAALSTVEVMESGKKLVAGFQDLIKKFFKNAKLTREQSAKIRDILETIESLARLHLKQFKVDAIDDTLHNQIISLHQRLSAHILPMVFGMQQVFSQEKIADNQKYVLEMVLDLIKDILALLPPGSQKGGIGNPPVLPEPLVPEKIERESEEFEDQ